MINEDDLRPGDLLQDKDGDFWHVHEDGKLWCSEPENRISFETADGGCGPFAYAPGYDPKRDKNRDSEDDSMKNEWNTGDIPSPAEAVAAYLRGRGPQAEVSDALSLPGIHGILDAVVDRLNAHYRKPDSSGVDWKAMYEQARGERDAAAARAEKAEDQWKKWECKAGQRGEMLIRAEAERDAAAERAEKAGRERDEWKARAEQLEKAAEANKTGLDIALARIRELKAKPAQEVPEPDPAVFVVRESDIAAVGIERDKDQGWTIPGRGWGWVRHSTAEELRKYARENCDRAAACEAVARAIGVEAEQAADPVEALADKFKNAAQSAVRVVVESLEPVVPGLKFADVDGLLADVSPEHWRTMARNVLDSSGGFDE